MYMSTCVAGINTPAKPVCGRHVAGTVVFKIKHVLNYLNDCCFQITTYLDNGMVTMMVTVAA